MLQKINVYNSSNAMHNDITLTATIESDHGDWVTCLALSDDAKSVVSRPGIRILPCLEVLTIWLLHKSDFFNFS